MLPMCPMRAPGRHALLKLASMHTTKRLRGAALACGTTPLFSPAAVSGANSTTRCRGVGAHTKSANLAAPSTPPRYAAEYTAPSTPHHSRSYNSR